MSRYLLLFLLNAPFIIAALLNVTVSYKLKRISRSKYVFYVLFWTTILAGIALTYPIYNFLFTRDLTQTEPLSLFDVVQITAIISVLYLASRTRAKLELMERRMNDLHQELSIQISAIKSSDKNKIQ